MKRKRQTSVIFLSYMERYRASSLDSPDLGQAGNGSSVSGSPQPPRKPGLSVLRGAPGFHGAEPWSPGPAGEERSLLYSAELLFLLLLGNVGTSSFGDAWVWLWVLLRVEFPWG